MTANNRLRGVLVTYRRLHELRTMLQMLATQTRLLDRLVIVDNDRNEQVRDLAIEEIGAARSVEYIAAPENLGPAGGLALGVGHLIRDAHDSDWITFLDDDDPPEEPGSFAELSCFAARMQQRDPLTAGVGLVGARFDYSAGLVRRVADSELHDAVIVDHIGGNQLPQYRVAAIRKVGLPNPKLFFGYEELEYGLRLRAAGWSLYVDGPKLAELRHQFGRYALGKTRVPNSRPPSWRNYYSTRNLIWILRSRGCHVAAARVALRETVAKPAYTLLRDPRRAWPHLVTNTRAAYDAYVGRMGRRIDP